MAARRKKDYRWQGRRAATTAVDGLLVRVAGGDEAAFADVYDQVTRAVYGLVHRIVADLVRAEQLTVEALTEVWRTASQFTAPDRLAAGHVPSAAAAAEDLPAHPGLLAQRPSGSGEVT
jgi:RNA polymerase sigma-70 factor (ECF subfamily)